MLAVAVVMAVRVLIVEPDGNVVDVLAVRGLVACTVLVEEALEVGAVLLAY